MHHYIILFLVLISPSSFILSAVFLSCVLSHYFYSPLFSPRLHFPHPFILLLIKLLQFLLPLLFLYFLTLFIFLSHPYLLFFSYIIGVMFYVLVLFLPCSLLFSYFRLLLTSSHPVLSSLFSRAYSFSFSCPISSLSCPSSCALSRRSTWQSPSTCSWTTRCSCSENTVCFSRLTTGSPCAASNTC